MGFWNKLLGRRDDKPIVIQGGTVVLRSREIAERLRRPTEPNFGDAPQGPCERCGRALDEVLITTGGSLGDPEVWRDLPIAVDGWACASCGAFRYPRRMSPERIHAITEEGAAHGRAGRIADAELCFTRIVWDWPGYLVGHLNYAEVTRDRLRAAAPADEILRRRLLDRMLEHYEAAVTAHEKQPSPELVAGAARAWLSIAEVSLERRSLERARRALDACLALEGLADADAAHATSLLAYIEERRDLFDEAAQVLSPYIHLMGRAKKEIETGEERKRVVEAVEKLEQHVALAPSSWRGAWLLAKGKIALGAPDALDVWRRAYAAHPHEVMIARDFSLDLLLHDIVAEAREVARAIAEVHPEDATLWCNRVVTEILSGDLDAAARCLARSLALDPEDRVAHALQGKLATIRAGAALPRTLRDLERL